MPEEDVPEEDLFEEAFGEDKEKTAAKRAKEAKAAALDTGKKVKVIGGEENANKIEAKGSKGEEELEKDSPEEKESEEIEGQGSQEDSEEDEKDEDSDSEENDEEESKEEEEKEEKEEAEEEKSEEGKKEEKEEPAEEKEEAEEKPKRKQRKPRGKPPIEEGPLREKIKRIVVAKAVKAAEKDESPPDKEFGIKEVGAKAEELLPVESGQPLASPVVQAIKPPIGFLRDEKGKSFIGRKKSVFQQYGNEGALFIGRVGEQDLHDSDVLLDSLNPHVVFVCGARGSGKSYVLGVMAEELALHNRNVGVIVVDPVGVFWGMKQPNREMKELELLAKWNLLPQGLENLKVFIPKGVASQVPKSTFDATFSMPPSLLTIEDWCLTFGIERFSPSGLLLEKAIVKVKDGYVTKDGARMKGKAGAFSLPELIACLQLEEDINSPEKGYKADSIRALSSRLDAANTWGIFDNKGTPLVELSREGQLTVIDTSFLEDNVSALVIGILARRILSARKVSTRRESAKKMQKEENVDQLLELGVPPTWLFIDEAHTLIPSGNLMTPASNALIEYVKQGRQPGCSLVFATQQPSAINTKVLSQLDVVIAHKLVFDDDVKAVYKRVPTLVPKAYRKSSFIKTLPVGVALVGDRREETARAFIMKIRPRMSQHEGREAETIERDVKLDDEKVLVLAVGMAKNKLEQTGSMPTATIDQVVKTLNAKYKSKIKLSDVLRGLEEDGAVINEENSTVSIAGEAVEEALAEELSTEAEKEVQKEAKAVFPEESIELIALPAKVSIEMARNYFNKLRKKRFLGIFGEEEGIEDIQLAYLPIYKIEVNAFDSKQTFRKAEAYVNSITGEFIHFDQKKNLFVESKGLRSIEDLTQSELKVLLLLEREREFPAIMKDSNLSGTIVKRLLQALQEKGFIEKKMVKGQEFFGRKKPIELPPMPVHPLLSSLSELPVLNIEAMNLMKEAVEKEKLVKSLQKLWGNIVIKKIDYIYLPAYETFLRKKDGTVRKILIDAFTGSIMKLGGKK